MIPKTALQNLDKKKPKKKKKHYPRPVEGLPFTVSRYGVMKELFAYQEELGRIPTYKELADRLDICHQSIGDTLYALKKRGFIKKVPALYVQTKEVKHEDLNFALRGSMQTTTAYQLGRLYLKQEGLL